MNDLIAIGFRLGFRATGFKTLTLVALLLIGSALLAATFSGRHPYTVGFDVGLTGLRFILLLMALIWVQDLLGRDIERKTLYFMLAYPYSRAQFLLARFASLALLLALATILLGLLLLGAMTLLGPDYEQLTPPALGLPYALALLGIWLDLLVVGAFAFLLCSLSTTPMLPLLLGLGFALAARGLGPTFDYLRSEAVADPDLVKWFKPVLEFSYLWLPDLSRLDWRPLALYGLPIDAGSLGLAGLMALGYGTLLLGLAVWIFQRRNFT